MITRIACFALVIILAAWASWMFRYEVNIEIGDGYFSVLDRWKQEQTICELDGGFGGVSLFTADCTVVGKREMGLW